jgi:hypothetical protein
MSLKRNVLPPNVPFCKMKRISCVRPALWIMKVHVFNKSSTILYNTEENKYNYNIT